MGRTRWVAVAVLATAGLAGCGDGGSDTGGPGPAVSIDDDIIVQVPGDLPDGVLSSLGIDGTAPPAAVDDRVLILGDDGTLSLIDPEERDAVSVSDIDDVIGVLDAGIVVVSGTKVRVLDRATLETVVEHDPPAVGNLVERAAADGDRIVAAYDDGHLLGLAAGSEEQLWRTELDPDATINGVFLRDDTVAVDLTVDDATAIWTFDANDGEPIGSHGPDAAYPDRRTRVAAVAGDGIVLLEQEALDLDSSPTGWLRLANLRTSRLLWEVPAESFFDQPLVTGGTIFAPNQDGNVHRIDGVTGEVATVAVGGRVEFAPVRHADLLVMVNDEADVIALDAARGVRAGDPVSLPEEVDGVNGWAVVDDVLYVSATESVLNGGDTTTLYGVDLDAFQVPSDG